MHMDTAMAERAALVALLRRPGASWSEIALSIQEIGSAATLLDRTVGQRDTLFLDADSAAELVAAAAEEISGWQADGIPAFAAPPGRDRGPRLRHRTLFGRRCPLRAGPLMELGDV